MSKKRVQGFEFELQRRLMLASNCAACGKKKSRFIKYQEASRFELH